MNYITTTKTGKGTITHEDQEIDGLKFQVKGDIYIIEGNVAKINEWKKRNNGTEMTEINAKNVIKTQEINGLQNTITKLKKELTDTEAKLLILTQ